ncbi:MAG: DUF6526 family protein [Gemmatimonadota bacterium]|nr:DUF6526 family protein [Gemmatimonadota bacterium]
MTTAPEQSAARHARFVPGFHYVAGTLALANLIWSIYRLVTRPGADSAKMLLVAVILLQLFWYLRQFPLVVQDRVIRLEERLRLTRLLPPDLQARIDELTPRQLVALRFASDAELPGLTRRVLAEKLTDPRAIKGLITQWRADHLRA